MATVIEQYIHYVGEQLAYMGPQKTAAFASCCAERLRPLYLKYSSDCGWDTHSYLDDALDTAYDVLLQQIRSEERRVGRECVP